MIARGTFARWRPVHGQIDGPRAVQACCQWDRRTCPRDQVPRFATPDRQAFLAIKALRVFAVNEMPVLAQRDMLAAMSAHLALIGMRPQPRPQCRFVRPDDIVCLRDRLTITLLVRPSRKMPPLGRLHRSRLAGSG
jgi:hypothetical protein